MTPSIEEQRDALERGRAYVDLSGWHLALVRGSDAGAWLNDLVTADIANLRTGDAARSLLLSPTGRIRADFTVARLAEGHLLVQDPAQPAPVATLLAPYVLSSDVRIEMLDGDRVVLAFVGGAPEVEGAETYAPSALGAGEDLVTQASERERVAPATTGLVEASEGAVDRWRIRRGIARFPVDLREDSLPHEAGLDALVAFEKGCFLGQEAVAKVRNLGRPPFVVIAAGATAPVDVGDALLDDGEEVGRVTSAVRDDRGAVFLARVRWSAQAARLRTASGAEIEVRRRAAATAQPV